MNVKDEEDILDLSAEVIALPVSSTGEEGLVLGFEFEEARDSHAPIRMKQPPATM